MVIGGNIVIIQRKCSENLSGFTRINGESQEQTKTSIKHHICDQVCDGFTSIICQQYGHFIIVLHLLLDYIEVIL